MLLCIKKASNKFLYCLLKFFSETQDIVFMPLSCTLLLGPWMYYICLTEHMALESYKYIHLSTLH